MDVCQNPAGTEAQSDILTSVLFKCPHHLCVRELDYLPHATALRNDHMGKQQTALSIARACELPGRGSHIAYLHVSRTRSAECQRVFGVNGGAVLTYGVRIIQIHKGLTEKPTKLEPVAFSMVYSVSSENGIVVGT